MTQRVEVAFSEVDLELIADFDGKIAIFLEADGTLAQFGKRIDKLTKGSLARLVASDAFSELKTGQGVELRFPTGMAAQSVLVLKLPKKSDTHEARKCGAWIAKAKGKDALLVASGSHPRTLDVILGISLRQYQFVDHKTLSANEAKLAGPITVLANKSEELRAKAEVALCAVDGVFFTRDLVSEPANVLTTTEFAKRLEELSKLGVLVEVLEEDALEALGMRSLLCVGQGSASPSKVVVMQWLGGEKEAAPLALVGKGVVFDTGGISLKPAAGMEDMTMDMGGAGVVAGVMKTIATRNAKANIVGLVGLVENMPSGTATRPGDIVKSMKGDMIEVINTDAEGRLVLCDVMWYTQERFAPCGMIDLATLTGAIIIGLGHENAGVFSNDDAFCDAFLKSAKSEGGGAWRMPLAPAYANIIKSNIADVKNSGGRAAGSITAAEFLHRFVKDGMPWIHLDIAGVASTPSETSFAPKGATGWGVRAIDRLIRDAYES